MVATSADHMPRRWISVCANSLNELGGCGGLIWSHFFLKLEHFCLKRGNVRLERGILLRKQGNGALVTPVGVQEGREKPTGCGDNDRTGDRINRHDAPPSGG